MPITRFLAAAPTSRGRFTALSTGSLSFAAALLVAPVIAMAQFSGDTGADLNSSSNSSNSSSDNNGSSGGVTTSNSNSNDTGNGSATSQLRSSSSSNGNSSRRGSDQPETRGLPYQRKPYQPSEFERYVQGLALQIQIADTPQTVTPQEPSDSSDSSGKSRKSNNSTNSTSASPYIAPIRRFGANLATDDAIASATEDPLPSVPGDYIVRSGDEVNLAIWGTVDADLHLTVDRAGRITVPRVGAISVAGLRNADLADAINRRVGQTFRNFQLSATLGQVRAIRVFVGGYVEHPGSITVNGLSSVLHAIMRTGGPSAAGSFRDIHLRRNGKEVAVFDLYDLLLKGERDTDQLVQPDDVIFVGPVGTQVAVLGSVNQQAIYELKPDETLADALRMAGGFNAVADRSRVSIERLADRSTGRVSELTLPSHATDRLATGDVLRIFSVISAALPQQYQREHVRIEGEVARPGDYILPPGSHVSDALRIAGGLTPAAYPYGTEFTRESVRKTQELNYDRALRDLETDISRTQASQRVTSSEELTAQNATAAANTRLLERLRQVRPTGRVVLQLPPDSTTLPDLALEDGDTLHIPMRSSSVGIFGSVFNTGSFVFEAGHTTGQYLSQAGGPTRGADTDSIFMIRANGSVISARQGSSFWHVSSDFNDAVVQPGDTLFVPEKVNKSTFVQDAKDWTQILYQFGLGLAGIKTLGL